MAGFTKADVNLLSRIRKNLREQIDHEEGMAVGADHSEHRDRLRKRDRLLREEREIEVLSARITQFIGGSTAPAKTE